MKMWTQRSVTRPSVPRRGTAWDGTLITGHSGLLSGTHVASNLGWRRVELLSVGDSVLTFDHGMQRIVDIHRETYLAPEHVLPRAQQPVRICQGAFNTRCDMWMMPDQGVMVECEAAVDMLGDPFAVIPAGMMVDLPGVEACAPVDQLEVTTLAFEADEVVYAEGALLVHCPRPRRILQDADDRADGLYNVLDPVAAHQLVEDLAVEMASAPVTADAPDLSLDWAN